MRWLGLIAILSALMYIAFGERNRGYGQYFIERHLEKKTTTNLDPEFSEFCVLPPYFRTKDGKGTDDDSKMTFAQCNKTSCIASFEPRRQTFEGTTYTLSFPRHKGGAKDFCVASIDHITIEVIGEIGLLLGHGGRAI